MTRSIPTTRILLISAGLPMLIVAVSLGVMLAWLPQLPATVAVHWDAHGADGFAAAVTVPLLLAVFGFGLLLLLNAFLVVGLRRVFGVVQKFIAAVAAGLGATLSAIFLASVGIQLGLDDPSRAPDITPWLLAGAAIGIVVGVAAWFALPRASRSRTDGSSGELRSVSPLPLAVGERAVWLGTARFAPWAVGLQILLVILVTAVVILSCVRAGGLAWLLLLVPAVVALALLSSVEWPVRVDDAGLHVRGLLGLPRWNIPVEDIAEAGTVDVAPMADFGGWGLRWWGRSRIGIVTRTGQGLEVRRHDGRSLTVTVDDAATAAELLTARIGAAR